MHFDQLQRREFIMLLGGAAAWPAVARAQQAERMRRIGRFSGIAADDPESQARIEAFVEALQHLGWTDGGNVRIDHRCGGGDADSDYTLQTNPNKIIAESTDWRFFNELKRALKS